MKGKAAKSGGLALMLMAQAVLFAGEAAKAAPAPYRNRWAAKVTPAKVHAEYPRPQMVRQEWLNLNGLWDYALESKHEPRPRKWDGSILVPFPVESALSGAMRRIGSAQRLWYQRAFKVPAAWRGKRVRLNFGAVDWEATVFINGAEAGAHRGGYDSFSLDITEHLNSTSLGRFTGFTIFRPSLCGLH